MKEKLSIRAAIKRRLNKNKFDKKSYVKFRKDILKEASDGEEWKGFVFRVKKKVPKDYCPINQDIVCKNCKEKNTYGYFLELEEHLGFVCPATVEKTDKTDKYLFEVRGTCEEE